MDSRNSTEFQEDILGLKQEPAGSLLPFMTDKTLALVAPFVIYWAHSLLYHIIDVLELPFFEKYRLHTPLEVRTRNKVGMFTVIYTVLFQQAVQTVIGLLWLRFEGPDYVLNHAAEMTVIAQRFAPLLNLLNAGPYRGQIVSALYWYIIPAFQFLVSILVMDSWQYWMHRFFHMNRFLYRHIHSRHHRLYVPYAFGALYNHPIEGLVMDTCGAGIAMSVARLTTRQSIVLFTFATLKTVDDHCGYKLPFNPLQRLFPNNAAYHDIHHQAFGIKKNFSQPFFTFWDKIMGSYLGIDQVPQKFRVKRDGKGAIIQPIDETGKDDGSSYSLDSNSDENEKKVNGRSNGTAKIDGTSSSDRNLRSRRKQA